MAYTPGQDGPLTVVCLKLGDKYGPEYVRNLRGMVSRNLTLDHEFVCITDDTSGCNCRTIEPHQGFDGWWGKIPLFARSPYGLDGRILFLDLDIVIVECIDEIAAFDAEFAIIDDWNIWGYNSSVFVLDVNTRTEVYDDFTPDVKTKFKSDQQWITHSAKGATVFPRDWCTSFRSDRCFKKPKGKIVVFHGDPKPHEEVGRFWVGDYWHE